MRLRFALAAALLLSAGFTAYGSTIYNVEYASNLSGTVTIDSVVGTITASDLQFTSGGTTVSLTGSGGSQEGRTGYALFYYTSSNAYELLLESPHADGTLKGFTGGEFMFSAATGGGASGDLVAAPTAAPEISAQGSLSCLALLGGVGALLQERKRLSLR